MIVGNDIVYLKAHNCFYRGNDHRFISKIFCEQEKVLLNRFGNNNHIVWLLWSAKEAAYKCCKRCDNNCLFSPVNFKIIHLNNIISKKIPANIFSNKTGKGIHTFFNFYTEVQYYQTKFFACSVITTTFIFTLASTTNNFEDIFWGIQKIGKSDYENQSNGVRVFLGDNFLFRKTKLSFFKDAYNRPSAFINDKGLFFPVSFSHDGPYVSYAFALEEKLLKSSSQNYLKNAAIGTGC